MVNGWSTLKLLLYALEMQNILVVAWRLPPMQTLLMEISRSYKFYILWSVIM